MKRLTSRHHSATLRRPVYNPSVRDKSRPSCAAGTSRQGSNFSLWLLLRASLGLACGSLLLEFYWMPLTSGLESWTGTWHLHCILCYSKAIDTNPIALFPGLLWLQYGSMQTGVGEDPGTKLTDPRTTCTLSLALFWGLPQLEFLIV